MNIAGLMLSGFKKQFQMGFKIKEVTRAEITANNLKDTVQVEVFGFNSGVPASGKSEEAKLSDRSQFTDMFLSEIQKAVKDIKKIHVTKLYFNFKIGEVKCDLMYLNTKDEKELIEDLKLV